VSRRSSLRAAIFAAFFLFIVASCGGSGNGPTSNGAIVPVTPRAGLHMGYYWGCRDFLLEQQGHIDTWMAVGLCSSEPNAPWWMRVAQELATARGAGVKNIILAPETLEPVALREQLQALSDGGWLRGWDSIGIYPLDDPGKLGYTDAQVTHIVTSIRQIGLDVAGLAGVHVGVLYGCDDPKPGIKAYDRVGCFRYAANGCAKLESDYAALRAQKSAAAMLWMPPGGALINGKDGHQDPACWASYAQRNLDVWGVIAFMWQGGADPHNTIVGIREQLDMRTLYCEMGRVILKPDAEPRC
jgi:hypothetical protein